MLNRSKQRRLSPDDIISMFNSITLKDDRKTLSNKECVDLLQEVIEMNEKVFGVKELQGSLSQSKKIDRLSAKKSDGAPLVIQKNSQKGG